MRMVDESKFSISPGFSLDHISRMIAWELTLGR